MNIKKIKDKNIPQFLLKCILFFAILFLLDFLGGNFLRYMYFKQIFGELYLTTYALDSTNANVLIFGSSTANHHYKSEIFEKRMNTSVYNVGRDGTNIFYDYAVLLGVLRRYTPKTILLDFNVSEFQKYQSSYDRLSPLLPYYYTHPEILPLISLKSTYEKYKFVSKIYPFNSLILSVISRNQNVRKYRKVLDAEKGYVALKRHWEGKIEMDTSDGKYELDSNAINTFVSFVQDCHDSNIELYITVSPRYIKYKSKDASIILMEKIADKFHLPVYDFLNDSTFLNHNKLFADRSHLNNTGATLFSNKVIDTILHDTEGSYIKKNKNAISPKMKKKFSYNSFLY
jgi:hypothetical protein